MVVDGVSQTALTDDEVNRIFRALADATRRDILRRALVGEVTVSNLAASVLKGKKKADSIRMLVGPGSARVRVQAELEGLDQVFLEFGAEWRTAG